MLSSLLVSPYLGNSAVVIKGREAKEESRLFAEEKRRNLFDEKRQRGRPRGRVTPGDPPGERREPRREERAPSVVVVVSPEEGRGHHAEHRVSVACVHCSVQYPEDL